MKGMLVFVYRNAEGPDCTNGGISGRATMLTVCGPGIPEIHEACDRAPAMVLKPAAYDGWKIEPAEALPEGHVGWMAGGNFASTSDSRWRKVVGFYGAVPIHDRSESYEQYKRLST